MHLRLCEGGSENSNGKPGGLPDRKDDADGYVRLELSRLMCTLVSHSTGGRMYKLPVVSVICPIGVAEKWQAARSGQ